jgi:uncharacterized LabA/DUF88 family protein
MEEANKLEPKTVEDKNNKAKQERIAIFIDGSNLYHSLKRLNVKIDFQKLIDILLRKRELVGVFYYTAPLDIESDETRYWKHQRFLEELRRIPKFNVVLCNLKRIKKIEGGGGFQYFIKGDDARLIHDFIVGAYEDLYDCAIIVSGDEDFQPMIKTAQKKGKKIGNAFFNSSSSGLLRDACDFSVCINRNINKIIRENQKDKKDPALPKDNTGSVINNK